MGQNGFSSMALVIFSTCQVLDFDMSNNPNLYHSRRRATSICFCGVCSFTWWFCQRFDPKGLDIHYSSDFPAFFMRPFWRNNKHIPKKTPDILPFLQALPARCGKWSAKPCSRQGATVEMVKNYAGSHCKEQFFWVNYNDLTVLPHWNHG